MSGSDRQLLSFGVFLIIIVVGILLALTGVIGWGLFVPVVAVLSGCWIIALAGMQTGKQLKYGRGTFSIMASGAGLIILGVAWYLFGIILDLLARCYPIGNCRFSDCNRPKTQINP